MNPKEIHKNPFNSIDDIINDSVFTDMLRKNINELKKSRENRPEPKKGFKYKRDWYDRMKKDNNFNFDYFIKNIPFIWVKKSLLSSEMRNVIKFVCDKSLNETLSIKFNHFKQGNYTV